MGQGGSHDNDEWTKRARKACEEIPITLTQEGLSVIYISEDQLSQVEYLIEQSRQGHHILFDIRAVRHAFRDDEAFSEEDAYSAEHHIEELMTKESLDAKRAYLDRLGEEEVRKVVRTYFNIVENNLLERIEEKPEELH